MTEEEDEAFTLCDDLIRDLKKEVQIVGK